MNTEKMFYNAVAIALEGNPSSMRTIKKKCRQLDGGLFGGWHMAYEMLAGGSHQTARRKLPHPEVEWEKLEHAGVRLMLRGDDVYPPALREMHHAPLAIYIRGVLPDTMNTKTEINAPPLAVVGTRRATADGKTTTKRFSRELAEAGCAIISGLALGIDASAHEGCLEAMASDTGYGGRGDGGTTVAVLAGGLDKFYPAENERLGRRIIEQGGAVISEYPLGEPPYPNRFLERNRIVCGLARGVLVVECPKRSGSLATASYAFQQNRDLFVVPGSITHPNFFGSHQLIRQGAELVTAPEEILATYGVSKKQKTAREALAANPEEKLILLALRDAATALEVDKIMEITKLEPRIVNQTISFLSLKHLIKETEMGYIIE